MAVLQCRVVKVRQLAGFGQKMYCCHYSTNDAIISCIDRAFVFDVTECN